MTDATSRVLSSTLGTELSEEEAGILGALMHEQTLEDGDFLIEEGTTDDAMHLIAEGKLEVVKSVSAGDTASLAVLREGDLAGELSFVDGAPHSVGLRALCDCRILTLARSDFETIIEKNPQLVYKVMRSVVRSAHRILHRMNLEFIELNNYIFKQHGRY